MTFSDTSSGAVVVSVVSHGHGPMVQPLLSALAKGVQAAASGVCRVVLTLNVPEAAPLPPPQGWPFVLQIIRNTQPSGFGANHNRAFEHDQRQGPSVLFAVLNPDLRLRANPFAALTTALQADARAGLAYPVQRNAAGRLQDHERRLPTPARLLARYLLRRKHEVGEGETPDWVNAAFLLLRREAYAEVGGFDERYHMYCEDVDLCLRLRGGGWRLARADAAVVEHAARRGSHRQWRHLGWHLRSLWRLWRSPAWRAASTQRPH